MPPMVRQQLSGTDLSKQKCLHPMAQQPVRRAGTIRAPAHEDSPVWQPLLTAPPCSSSAGRSPDAACIGLSMPLRPSNLDACSSSAILWMADRLSRTGSRTGTRDNSWIPLACSWDGERRFNDLWQLSTVNWQWKQLQPAGIL